MNVSVPPLRNGLRDPFEDADLAPLWPAIEARRVPKASSRASALVTLGAVVATALALRAPAPLGVPTPGPLHRASGGPVASLDGAGESKVFFADRSSVELSPDARLEPLRNDGRFFEVSLLHGRARFDVTPRGPRRWTIHCGLATVTVLGTSFVTERSPERVRVTVLHGLVRVASAHLAGGVRVLSDGESIELRSPTPEPQPPPQEPPSPLASLRPRPARASREPWRDFAARRDFERAWEALGPNGTTARLSTASADDLLALGEVAHRSQHYAEAAALYTRFVRMHRAHPQAPVVGFTLGRIQLEQLGDARAAAESFGAALELGAPRHLQEDLHVRRIEALARAGDRDGARTAAERYHQLFPSGRRSTDVQRWVQ